MNTKTTAYDVAMQSLDRVADIMQLSDEVLGFLRAPQRSMIVELPVRMDDGSLRFFTGYRVQHNHALGPVKGGTRLHPDETLDDVKALAFWMTVKNSLAGIPAGGGKGGIAVEPSTLSLPELERLCRAYIRAIFPILGPKIDIPGPDMGTPQQVMAWFMDEYENIAQHHEPAVFAGKPPLLGGSLGRDRATGYGLVYVMEKMLQLRGENLAGQRIAIQGFGNLGTHAADLFTQKSAIVIAVSDVHGGIFNANGINVKEAMNYIREKGSLTNFPGCDSIGNAELLELKCDILAPCALQSQITAQNAGRIKARYIAEGANGPTTPEAEDMLLAAGVCIVPDVVANAGGTTVSYFELVQDLYQYFWPVEEVFPKMGAIMQKSTEEVYAQAVDKKVSLRQAAWITSLGKVVSAMKLRGWVR